MLLDVDMQISPGDLGRAWWWGNNAGDEEDDKEGERRQWWGLLAVAGVGFGALPQILVRKGSSITEMSSLTGNQVKHGSAGGGRGATRASLSSDNEAEPGRWTPEGPTSWFSGWAKRLTGIVGLFRPLGVLGTTLGVTGSSNG